MEERATVTKRGQLHRIRSVVPLVGMFAVAAALVAAASIGPIHLSPEQSEFPSDPPPRVATGLTQMPAEDTSSGQVQAMPDDRIPAGKNYGTLQVTAAQGMAASHTDPSEFVPFPYLAREDFTLYQELRANGAAFKLMQGDDRYFHIVR
jgi:hypothetical protein